MKKIRFIVSSILIILLFALGIYTSTSSNRILSQTYTASSNSVFESFSDASPCNNNVNAIIFLIEFQDVKFNPQYSDYASDDTILSSAELQNAVFGKEDTSSPFYPYESVSAYYKRSSYGALNISGIVRPYTAKYDRSYYDSTNSNEDSDSSEGYERLAMEVMDYYNDEIDFTQYDVNQDGLLDNIYFSVPLNGEDGDSTWWGNQSVWQNYMDYNVDDEYPSKYVILDGQPFAQNISYYNQICIHETGHLMGLPDYYNTYAIDNNFEGFSGMAGYDMMDEMSGDHNAFSKIMLGWIKNSNVQIVDSSSSKKDYYLSSIEDTKDVLLIPIHKWNGNYCSEYYLLEYDNATFNNTSAIAEYTSYLSDEDTIISLEEQGSGLRIWHVNARLTKDLWEKECSMFAYDSNTTNSKKHLLALVKNPTDEYDGFFRTGDQITLPHGPTVTVGEIEGGKYNLLISY